MEGRVSMQPLPPVADRMFSKEGERGSRPSCQGSSAGCIITGAGQG